MKPGIDPRVDYAFKKVFGSVSSTPILLDFLNAVLKPPPERRIVEPHIVNPFNEKDAADDKRLDVWCYFLQHAVELDTNHLPKTMDTPPVRQALEVLDMLSKNEAERERYNARVKGERDFRSGLREAREEGELKRYNARVKGERDFRSGLREAREEGELIGRIHAYQRMLNTTQSPADELLGRSPQELLAKANALEQQLGLT